MLLFDRSSTDFLFSDILTFQNYVVVVCNRTMNDIDYLIAEREADWTAAPSEAAAGSGLFSG